MLVPYIIIYSEDGTYFELLKPTGRWKLESGAYGENIMSVQHRGTFFKWWISEDRISFRPAPRTIEFNCKEDK